MCDNLLWAVSRKTRKCVFLLSQQPSKWRHTTSTTSRHCCCCPSTNLASDPEKKKNGTKSCSFKSSTAIDITLLDNIHTLSQTYTHTHTQTDADKILIIKEMDDIYINTAAAGRGRLAVDPAPLLTEIFPSSAALLVYILVYIIIIILRRALVLRQKDLQTFVGDNSLRLTV